MLPDDLGSRLRGLWEEFEAGETDEARFARALDRLQAFAQNVFAGGKSWQERGISRQVSATINLEARASFPILGAVYESLERRAESERLWASDPESSPER